MNVFLKKYFSTVFALIILAFFCYGCCPLLWQAGSSSNRFVNEDNHEFDSSLAINTILNKTIFYKDSINNELKLLPPDTLSDTLFEILPTVEISIFNRSSIELFAPYHNLCYGPAEEVFNPGNSGATIGYIMGNINGPLPPPEVPLGYSLVERDCLWSEISQIEGCGLYEVLLPEEKKILPDKLTPFIRYTSIEIPDTGLFWIRVGLWNYISDKLDKPVWTGSIWADTVWFQVR